MRRLLYFIGAICLSTTTLAAVHAMTQNAASQSPSSSLYYEQTYTFEWVNDAPITIDCYPEGYDSWLPVHQFQTSSLPSGSTIRGGLLQPLGVGNFSRGVEAVYVLQVRPVQSVSLDTSAGWAIGGFGTMPILQDALGTPLFIPAQDLQPALEVMCASISATVENPIPLTIDAGTSIAFSLTVGHTTPLPEPADANCDGTIDLADSLRIRRILAGFADTCQTLEP